MIFVLIDEDLKNFCTHNGLSKTRISLTRSWTFELCFQAFVTILFCSQAAAYYYHSQVLEEGCEDNVHAQSLSCMKASHAFLKGSQKARNEFGNTEPLTKYSLQLHTFS